MELRIKKEELLQSTGRAQAISEKRSSMQILSNLLLDAAGPNLKIMATDLEIGFKGDLEAEVIEPGRVCLPARTFHSIVRELAADEVYLKEEENHRVFIEGGRTRYHLAGLPPDEYPSLPQHEEVSLIKVEVRDLKEMLDKTVYSMASEEGRYNLAGVFLEKMEEEGQLRMVSTDGHRLSLVDRHLERLEELDLAKGAIIPRKGVLEMIRLLEEAETAQIGVKGSAAVLKVGQAMLMMRLLEARYPDYNQVIPPPTTDIAFQVKRPELLEGLRRITILITDNYRGVNLKVEPQSLTILLQNPDLGDAKEQIEADYDGQNLELGFNAAYLIDAL
ncbi:MAG: DNA polymerase III subunit beta, partial [Deltaproteobacteria bacterium]|nr:DNA polymerase III subunit beta [Deltaproteobacteria bacterium]